MNHLLFKWLIVVLSSNFSLIILKGKWTQLEDQRPHQGRPIHQQKSILPHSSHILESWRQRVSLKINIFKRHIPYRNSSLTKILRSSLGGNSRTLIILCINPTYSQFEFSLSTIRFGLNAKKIENKVRPNIRNNNDDEAIKIIIAEYEKRIRDLEKARNDDKENLEFLRV